MLQTASSSTAVEFSATLSHLAMTLPPGRRHLLFTIEGILQGCIFHPNYSIKLQMAAFASISACSLATPATISISRGSISQHKSFTAMGVPVVCNGLKVIPKIQFSKTNKLSTRSSCFRTPVSCSLADPETLKTVQDTIAKQLSIDVSTVTPETKFADLGADSLDTVEIMMALEEQFGVSVGEGGAENIATVQDAAELIEKVKAAA
ncbi:hypothetical protein V6N13_062218 [Hibiscus sabdariffa]|uniref:Acyl carrier protein n=1 Tax=Hibiscus sabdariffa TaxID=183260 RepID=A0ABR2NAK5_9ROSI